MMRVVLLTFVPSAKVTAAKVAPIWAMKSWIPAPVIVQDSYAVKRSGSLKGEIAMSVTA
jgi:hypothetical protein